MGVTAFTEFPSALVLARTALALAAFCFLPGYFLALSRAKAKNFLQPLAGQAVEAIAESVFASMALLGFSVMLLMFSIGFSYFALLALELLILFGTWWYWRKSI